jgi:hypothetical protein
MSHDIFLDRDISRLVLAVGNGRFPVPGLLLVHFLLCLQNTYQLSISDTSICGPEIAEAPRRTNAISWLVLS